MKTQFITPNPDCPDCFGTGEVTDIVPYGSTTANLISWCECVEKQADEDTDEIVIEEADHDTLL